MNPLNSFQHRLLQLRNPVPPPNRTNPPAGATVEPFSPGGRVRVFVVLPNGSKLVIPITVSSSISDLQSEALRRARVLRSPYEEENTVLRLGAQDGAIAFEEDLIEDILDLADDNTFWLVSLEQTLQTIPGPIQPQRRDYQVYVRWITAARAIGSSQLSDIALDAPYFPSKTTLSELKTAAFEQLYAGSFPPEEKPLSDTAAELFLASCHLSTTDSDSVTLADLQLEGTLQDPLDLFVVLQKKPSLGVSDSAKPYSTLPFARTERGLATFFTSLKVLLREIKTKGGLQEILKALWEVTHFPPALIAFQQLHDGSELRPLQCTILATCFRELALKMIPSWITENREEYLESSRQIFSWVYSLYSEASKEPAGSDHALVHAVNISELFGASTGQEDGCNVSVVALLASGGPSGQSPSPSSRTIHQVCVSRERRDNIPASLLAMAQWGSYDAVNNYYVDWPAGAERYSKHKRLPLLNPDGFNDLLATTNQSDAFKLVGPHDLSRAILPVVSLNKDGYVSVYDLQSKMCGEYYPATWNIISGNESLSATDPGQFLAQKLQTIIAQRKKTHTWEVDAWANEGGITGPISSPEEAIVICVDRSSSMQSPMGPFWMPRSNSSTTAREELSRLNEVQEVFQNFVARTAAYKISTHLGLVVFSGRTQVTINQDLTPVLYDFKDRIKDITPTGSTAIWDALVQAKEMLVRFRATNPASKLRIIVLTDGEDNDSRKSADFACRELYSTDIVLDSIVIGTTSTDDLFKISKHTGGYAFCPKTRSALFQIFLLETFVDITMRPDIVRIPVGGSIQSSTPKAPDMASTFDFPQCRVHPNQNDSFIDLRQSAKLFLPSSRSSVASGYSSYSRASSVTVTAQSTSLQSWDAVTLNSGSHGSVSSGASGAHRIILREVRHMAANQHPYMDVYISESNMGFWKVVMQGPPASPYAGATFVLYIEMGDRFPRQAPSARFITPVLHPNITKHGRICHAVFDRDWNPEMHIFEVLQNVYGIFMTLEVRDAIDPMSTLKFWTDPESGEREVAQYIQHFANRDRAWHREKILELS